MVVNYNTGSWLRRCLAALVVAGETARQTLDIRVVDNHSTDDSLNAVHEYPVTLLTNPVNRGFGAACNQGALGLEPDDLLLLLNPDLELAPDCLVQLIKALDDGDNVGMVGAMVLNSDGSLQKATLRRLPTVSRTLNTLLGNHARGLGEVATGPQDPRGQQSGQQSGQQKADQGTTVEAVSGAVMLLPGRSFLALGGFDERYFLHCEDLDLMRRLGDGGWQIRLATGAIAHHAQGVSHRSAPLKAQIHKHRSLCRYFGDRMGRPGGLLWKSLIWSHFLLRAPGWWLAARRGE